MLEIFHCSNLRCQKKQNRKPQQEKESTRLNAPSCAPSSRLCSLAGFSSACLKASPDKLSTQGHICSERYHRAETQPAKREACWKETMCWCDGPLVLQLADIYRVKDSSTPYKPDTCMRCFTGNKLTEKFIAWSLTIFQLAKSKNLKIKRFLQCKKNPLSRHISGT